MKYSAPMIMINSLFCPIEVPPSMVAGKGHSIALLIFQTPTFPNSNFYGAT
jgi:hypothetical protein